MSASSDPFRSRPWRGDRAIEDDDDEICDGIDHFDRLPDSPLLVIFNRIGDVKALGRCSVVSKRFQSLVPLVDNVVVRVVCVISDDPSPSSVIGGVGGVKARGVFSNIARLVQGLASLADILYGSSKAFSCAWKQIAGAGIDLSSLVIVEGKICWDLYIDGLVVSFDGNLLDALAAAIKVALSDEEFLQFDTSGIPVIITLTKVGRHYIVDAISEEESQMSSAVSVSMNRHGQICGMTKRGGASVDPSVIFDMISVALRPSSEIRDPTPDPAISTPSPDSNSSSWPDLNLVNTIFQQLLLNLF